MSRPISYSKSIIYKICCNDPNITDIYIDGTCNIVRRRHLHKTECTKPENKKYNNYVYRFIRDNGGWNNWSIIMIEEYKNCNSKLELTKRISDVLMEHKATLNINKPMEIVKEDNDKIKCVCGSVINKKSLTRHSKTKKHISYELSEKVKQPNITENVKQPDITDTPIET